VELEMLRSKLLSLGEDWSVPISKSAHRTDTHDMSFMIQPSMRVRWEVLGDTESLQTIIRAANSLYTRYNAKARAIRSWDALTQHGVTIDNLEENFLVIIDSMCNLDLLYYAAGHSGESYLAEAATQHAKTLLATHLRKEQPAGYTGTSPMYSSFHVVNMSPKTGEVLEKRTGQGFARDSTWARGQAWGILGYAQTYGWTKDVVFLDAAIGLAEYFMYRLAIAPSFVEVRFDGGKRTIGRYVPLWDFDAPVEDESSPLRDSSAGVIAANGLLVLSQVLAGFGRHEDSARYRRTALAIIKDTLDFSLAREKAELSFLDGNIIVKDVIEGSTFDAILKNATANRNAQDFKRYWNHGLVYADYYLIEFGNRLLEMGFV
jgi:hypothetical protein